MTEPADLRIDGGGVVLRDWRTSDHAPLTRLLDPDQSWHATNGPYFGRPTELGMTAARDRMLELATQPPDERPVPRPSLAIALPDDDRVVGAVSWSWESEPTDWRRMGIVLYDEGVRGRGVGRAALGTWTDYLFAATDALRLDLATYSGNHAMIAVAEALGFTLEARMRKARRWEGGDHDALVYGVLREEWDERASVAHDDGKPGARHGRAGRAAEH